MAAKIGKGYEKVPQPADQHTVRRHNLGLVLTNVAKGGPRSRAKISSETGLNPSTVSSLTSDLIDRRMLRESGLELSGAIGRPGRNLEINPEGGVAIGVEIGDDGIGVLALDLSGARRYRAFVNQENRDLEPSDVVKQLVGFTQEALASFQTRDQNLVCTVALPGLVSAKGDLLEAPNVDWHKVPLMDLWREHSGPLPLATDNEARLAAYAEMIEGAAQDLRSFAYLSGGTGLGTGIVLDRKIYRGAHGFAGEFGHITIDPAGKSSTWGARGTLEALAGERALAELADLTRRDASGRSDPDWIGRQIAMRASDGDRKALNALDRVGHTLGVGLAILSNLLDTEAIVLGGFFTHLSEWLRTPIEEELSSRVLANRWSPGRILFSTMGREAAVRGAAAWSLDLLLNQHGPEDQLRP